MIIKGGPAGNVGWWTKHLLRDDTNEHVEVKEISGVLAEDLPTALLEMRFIAAQSRSRGNFMYQANINPREDEHLTPEQWMDAVETLERNLGLDGHQRIIIEHVKEGRQHVHIVWNRVDVETLKVADVGGNYRVHEKTARELEERLGLTPTPSPDKDREPAPELWEMRAAERSGVDPKALKAELTDLWRNTENGQEFQAMLKLRGYILSKGDRRDFCVVDQAGDAHSLARRLDGVKAKDVREHMADVDRDSLPTVAEAREIQRDRALAREADVQHEDRADEPGAPEHDLLIYDRDAAGRAWEDQALEAAVAKAEAEEAREAGSSARSGQPRPFDRDRADQQWHLRIENAAIEQAQKEEAAERVERKEWRIAWRQLNEAHRTDQENLKASENADFWSGVEQRRDASSAKVQGEWQTERNADVERIDEVTPAEVVDKGLAVFDVATGAADTLVNFLSLLGGGSPEPRSPEAMDQVDQIKAQRKALAALENIRDCMARGHSLSASDVRNLTPTHLENLRLRGDDYLRHLIDGLDRDRQRDRDGGRDRER